MPLPWACLLYEEVEEKRGKSLQATKKSPETFHAIVRE